MNRTEFLSPNPAVSPLWEALRRHCSSRHAAIALSVALPYLAATAALLLR